MLWAQCFLDGDPSVGRPLPNHEGIDGMGGQPQRSFVVTDGIEVARHGSHHRRGQLRRVELKNEVENGPTALRRRPGVAGSVPRHTFGDVEPSVDARTRRCRPVSFEATAYDVAVRDSPAPPGAPEPVGEDVQGAKGGVKHHEGASGTKQSTTPREGRPNIVHVVERMGGVDEIEALGVVIEVLEPLRENGRLELRKALGEERATALTFHLVGVDADVPLSGKTFREGRGDGDIEVAPAAPDAQPSELVLGPGGQRPVREGGGDLAPLVAGRLEGFERLEKPSVTHRGQRRA